MDETTYINLIKAQITSLSAQASAALGSQHQVSLLLLMASTTINQYNTAAGPAAQNPAQAQPEPAVDPAIWGPARPVLPGYVQAALAEDAADEAQEPRPIPVGFENPKQYHEFLEQQFEEQIALANAERQFDDEYDDGDDAPVTGADIAASIKDVVGLVPDAAGNLREVGNIDEAVEFANNIIEQAETRYIEGEDGNVEAVREEIETDNAITITYTRGDGQALTDENVRTIIDSPISASLRHLGNIQLVAINDGDTANVKSVVFALIEDGKIDLRAIALGAVAYKGQHVFPGIGRVQAVGSVNFA